MEGALFHPLAEKRIHALYRIYRVHNINVQRLTCMLILLLQPANASRTFLIKITRKKGGSNMQNLHFTVACEKICY